MIGNNLIVAGFMIVLILLYKLLVYCGLEMPIEFFISYFTLFTLLRMDLENSYKK